MSIEELVNRAYTTWAHDKGTSWTDLMRAALSEQAATHAIELRAYEATVENLEQRIRELEATGKPGLQVDVELVPVEAELDALRKDAERYRWLRNHEKFNYRVHRATQIGGHEMDEAIDSAMQERQP